MFIMYFARDFQKKCDFPTTTFFLTWLFSWPWSLTSNSDCLHYYFGRFRPSYYFFILAIIGHHFVFYKFILAVLGHHTFFLVLAILGHHHFFFIFILGQHLFSFFIFILAFLGHRICNTCSEDTTPLIFYWVVSSATPSGFSFPVVLCRPKWKYYIFFLNREFFFPTKHDFLNKKRGNWKLKYDQIRSRNYFKS